MIKKAFSLIELLISLIIISLITSVFAPVITGKLKQQSISLNSKQSITCPIGTYKSENLCLACSENCSICEDALSCQKCEEGYHLEEKICKKDIQELLPSEQNCSLVNAMYIKAAYNGTGGKDLCVSKFNAGDPNGPPLYDDIEIRQATAPSGSTLDDSAKVCWQGSTTNKCIVSSSAATYNFTYNSCTRTICTFEAAQAICKKYGWRLPKYSELLGWNNNFTYVTKYMGERGLQLCGHTSNWHPQCDHVGGCKGSNGNSCMPDALWYENSPTKVAVLGNDILQFESARPTSTASVRCVAEIIKY